MLHVQNIKKIYPGTVALDDVSIKFENGSIHALLGKNGAGKSTLVKIISGATLPSSGKILVDDREVHFNSPNDAFKEGIGTVYQELSLIPQLTIAENIFLGRLPKKKNSGGIIVDWDAVFQKSKDSLNDLQISYDVKLKVSDIGVAGQQLVEIAKAMSYKPSVLILDEPTSALAYHEVENLFSLLNLLRKKGVAIIYITHRMQEIQQIADQVSILRDGKHVGTIEGNDAKPVTIVSMMFGEIISKIKPIDFKVSEEPILEVKNFNHRGKFSDINFHMYKGEILGIAGMLGSGRTELLRAIFGADSIERGEVHIQSIPVKKIKPRIMKRLGVGFISENRKEEGLIQNLNTRINMCLSSYSRISSKGILNKRMENKVLEKYTKDLDIKLSDSEESVSSLSGGNQQKVIIAKWLNIKPKVLLLDEPTRGIDIQTKQQIFQIIWDLSGKGISSVFVSTELEELIEVCHRILIMKKGKIVKEVQPAKITPDELFVLCMEN